MEQAVAVVESAGDGKKTKNASYLATRLLQPWFEFDAKIFVLTSFFVSTLFLLDLTFTLYEVKRFHCKYLLLSKKWTLEK